MRKSQGLSLNTMVIAAIVLVVLVISIAIFTGFVNTKAVPFFSGQTECETKVSPGKCINAGDNCEGTKLEGLGCGSGEVCCQPD